MPTTTPTPGPTSLRPSPTTTPVAFPLGDPEESLGLLLTQRDCPSAFPGATAHRFELNSHGDRVIGRLLIPEEHSDPQPLIVIQGDAGESCDAANLEFAGSWVSAGFALATIDLPLHGLRSSPKFSERLLRAIEGVRSRDGSSNPPDANGTSLLLEFTRQSVADLSRTLDALGALPAIDGQRIGVMGVGHGAAIAAVFASVETRAQAVVLAHSCAIGLHEIDPIQWVGDIGPRSVLLLESSRTPLNSTDGFDAQLFGACAEPKFRDRSDDEFGKIGIPAAEIARQFFAQRLLSG